MAVEGGGLGGAHDGAGEAALPRPDAVAAHQREVPVRGAVVGEEGGDARPVRVEGSALREQIARDGVARDPDVRVAGEVDLVDGAVLRAPGGELEPAEPGGDVGDGAEDGPAWGGGSDGCAGGGDGTFGAGERPEALGGWWSWGGGA